MMSWWLHTAMCVKVEAPDLSSLPGCGGWAAMILPVGVQPNGLDGIPVAGPACPGAGMPPANFLVEPCAARGWRHGWLGGVGPRR